MIDLSIKNETAFINLHPEHKFNILEPSAIRELYEKIKTLYDSPAKVIRITGHGGSFAVGANIKTMLTYSGYTAKGFSQLGNKLFGLMDNIPQIIIAEIDGFCMGGGMDFAASCDFRFATKTSKFAHPGAKLGIITGFGGTQRISRLMKDSYFTSLIISGETCTAEFMKEGEFITEVFNTKESMQQYTEMFTKAIVNKNRLFLNEIKTLINKQR